MIISILEALDNWTNAGLLAITTTLVIAICILTVIYFFARR